MSDHEPDPRHQNHEPDPVFDELEHADPAAGAEPDIPRLKALVEERVGVPRTSSGSSQYLWMRVAAAVVGAAVIGAAGFIIGSRSSAATTQASGSPAATVTTVFAADEGFASSQAGPGVAPEAAGPIRAGAASAAATSMAGGASGGAAVGSAASGDKAATDAMGISMGRAVFSDGGVTGDAGTAEAFSYDAASVVTPERAEALGAAFGVSGAAVAQWGSWVVGATDGSAPQVSLSGDAMASFNYYDPSISYGYSCASATVMAEDAAPDAAGGGGDVAVDSMPMDCAPSADSAPALSAEDAVARVVALITTVGQDPAGYAITADPYDMGPGYRSVTAAPLVDGVPAVNSSGWQVSFYGDVISYAYGQLAPLVSAGTYDVISAADAVARLGDPRFGPVYPTYPADYVWPEYAGGVTDENAAPAPPAAVTGGGAIPWPVAQVTITGATLGLSPQYLSSGGVVLAPTYTLTADGGLSWTVIAVADSRLDFG